MIPTFHILIATAGRPSLKYMLNSLRDQLTEKDAITVVFDGERALEKSQFSQDWLKGHLSKISILEEKTALGFWGHGIRNKHQGLLNPETSFIMNADDDDMYYGGTFERLRKTCIDPDTLYIANFCKDSGLCVPYKGTASIQLCNIGTPCGIIPYSIANKSIWLYEHGGDFYYYKMLSHFVKKIIFLNDVIYKVNPAVYELVH